METVRAIEVENGHVNKAAVTAHDDAGSARADLVVIHDRQGIAIRIRIVC